MTGPRATPSRVERALGALMLALFWAAFACLFTGLALWLARAPRAGALLALGLGGLMAIPILRLVETLAVAIRQRDRVLFGATLAVLAILFALTIRDAASMR